MMIQSTSCALISAPITVRFNQEIDGAVLIECAYHHCRGSVPAWIVTCQCANSHNCRDAVDERCAMRPFSFRCNPKRSTFRPAFQFIARQQAIRMADLQNILRVRFWDSITQSTLLEGRGKLIAKRLALPT
jgi:hypothetical protein